MDLDELRAALMAQHHQLKRLITTARRLSTQIGNGGANAARALKLRDILEELNRALDAHTYSEDTALQPILATIDAWGPERVARMYRNHRAEHRAMAAVLETGCSPSNAKKLAAAARAMADELMAHILDEEKYFLNRSVLTHDVIRVDQPTD
jgi:iron-sulfur cluster repair protein YtfE (RIC family)